MNELSEKEKAKQEVLKILTENLESLELIRLTHESMVLKHRYMQEQRDKFFREMIPVFIVILLVGVAIGFSLKGWIL